MHAAFALLRSPRTSDFYCLHTQCSNETIAINLHNTAENSSLSSSSTTTTTTTRSRKFIYADDICLGTQGQTFSKIEEILDTDLEKVADYFKKWRLQPSLSKTVSSVHHLHNARANQTLKLLLNDQTIRHEPNPVYLGVTLDRMVTWPMTSRDVESAIKTHLSVPCIWHKLQTPAVIKQQI